MIHTSPIFPLDTSWLENHSPNYPPLTILTSKWVDCPGGKYQQQLQSFWKGGLLTTFTGYNIANAGIAHPTTYNLEILWSWGRTTRLHSTGPQRSSLMSTQAQMAEYEWSQSRPPKWHLNAPLQKFAPFRMLRMSYSSITIWGVPVCSCRGQIYWIIWFEFALYNLMSLMFIMIIVFNFW